MFKLSVWFVVMVSVVSVAFVAPMAPVVSAEPSVCTSEQDLQCVHRDSIKVLFFDGLSLTEGRRSPPVQQVNCTNCWSWNPVGRVRCDRVSAESKQQWLCTTLSDGVSVSKPMHNVVISCEGCLNEDDPYVLKGSCGLTYETTTQTWTDIIVVIVILVLVGALVFLD